MTYFHTITTKYVNEFYDMNVGELISDPNEKILFTSDTEMSRRALKHFVESRTKQGLSKEEILYLLDKAPQVIRDPELNMPNASRSYPNSFLLGRFYENKNKAVMVVLDFKGEIKEIISLHFKNKSDFKNLLELCGN